MEQIEVNLFIIIFPALKDKVIQKLFRIAWGFGVGDGITGEVNAAGIRNAKFLCNGPGWDLFSQIVLLQIFLPWPDFKII